MKYAHWIKGLEASGRGSIAVPCDAPFRDITTFILNLKQNNVKYKILKGCEVFNKLTQIDKQIQAARKKIRAYVKKVGGTKFGTDAHSYLVKCSVVEFDKKPEGWTIQGPTWQRFYTPLAKNKTAREEINALPQVKNEALNSLVNFNDWIGENLCVCYRPGVHFGVNYHLIEVPEEFTQYKPIKEMQEITVSEFNQLQKKIKSKDQ